MIKLPEKCLRDSKDCFPLSQIASDNGETFFCCGEHDGSCSIHPQDEYTICFMGDDIDQISHNDKWDLTHQLSVIAGALAVIAERE